MSADRLLIVEPEGGLANRLRVVASAVTTAAASGRELRLRWKVDGACGARWEELFENRIPAFVGGLPAGSSVYEKMPRSLAVADLGACAVDPAPVVLINTCFDFRPRAMSKSSALAARASFYRSLVPIDSVRRELDELLATNFDGRPIVGVHVRRSDLRLAGDSGQVVSPTALFIEKMRRLVAADAATAFFLSSDDPREEETLRQAFPDRVFLHPKTNRDRASVAALREALVDWLALARTRLILRSAGSSFSREAAIAGSVPYQGVKRRLWPYDRPRYWVEALQRRGAALRRVLRHGERPRIST